MECVCSANRLIKQIDDCPMEGPISAVPLKIYVCKMEEDMVARSKPLFYKRLVDDTYVKRKYKTDYKYKNIELDSTKFLDTEIIRSNSKIKMKKLPANWASIIPLKYKYNGIISKLHRAKKITSNFDMEIKTYC